MTHDTQMQKSKFLSYVLRHKPETIDLTLGEGGWVRVETLLARANEHGTEVARDELFEIVAADVKQRFTLSQDGTEIRAAQGHSVRVTLGLNPLAPPQTLFHGTAVKTLAPIREQGLQPRNRQQVHLSKDVETARTVGQRHGKPVVLRVASGTMHRDGHQFFQADNGVWLTDYVPPEYLAEV